MRSLTCSHLIFVIAEVALRFTPGDHQEAKRLVLAHLTSGPPTEADEDASSCYYVVAAAAAVSRVKR